MRSTLALVVVALLAACGGSSKAPASSVPEPTPPAASCCCDFIREEGDPEGDNWSENQTFELMDEGSCADVSGTCVDVASCSGADVTPP